MSGDLGPDANEIAVTIFQSLLVGCALRRCPDPLAPSADGGNTKPNELLNKHDVRMLEHFEHLMRSGVPLDEAIFALHTREWIGRTRALVERACDASFAQHRAPRT